ncbi:hypothetical protein TSUD_192050 [Trifolium subterraneum]|uniref:Uncharacterized protein n=1 Tax=Trifolium subterraneum TaxID=3900 RepID=A0A2Z6PL12_TRISU|nr:hypothetical protein TSUD_192050 [Trifolium subterraneum]
MLMKDTWRLHESRNSSDWKSLWLVNAPLRHAMCYGEFVVVEDDLHAFAMCPQVITSWTTTAKKSNMLQAVLQLSFGPFGRTEMQQYGATLKARRNRSVGTHSSYGKTGLKPKKSELGFEYSRQCNTVHNGQSHM